MPPKTRKRKSEHSEALEMQDMPMAATTMVATNQSHNSTDGANKRRKIGVTTAQKQAFIDNLQLEVSERARKLRAQYNLQAQGLRTRIEIRVNRIPMALRRVKMGDLVHKYSAGGEKRQSPKQLVTAKSGRSPPPVPEKDSSSGRPVGRGAPSPRAALAVAGRPTKYISDGIAGGDKENQIALLDNTKKRQWDVQNTVAHASQVQGQVLSPASSNSRLNMPDRERVAPPSPAKSFIARPVSPAKQAAATSLLSSMVEKARSTRVASSRKPTVMSSGSSVATAATGNRTRRGAAGTGPGSKSAAGAASRNTRRISGVSEASDSSTSTIVRKTARGATTATVATAKKTKVAATAPAAKKNMMSTLKKGVANAAGRKAAATAKASATTTAPATTRSGRVLRKRE